MSLIEFSLCSGFIWDDILYFGITKKTTLHDEKVNDKKIVLMSCRSDFLLMTYLECCCDVNSGLWVLYKMIIYTFEYQIGRQLLTMKR